MTSAQEESLETVIRQTGEGWIIDSFAPPQGAMSRIHALLRSIDEELRKRFGRDADPIDEPAIIAEYKRSPHKVHAFIQALGQTESPQMLIAVWQILQGWEISQIELQYQLMNTFDFHISLMPPGGGTPESYRSADIDDAALFRHFGILKMKNKPVFDGFYPAPWAF